MRGSKVDVTIIGAGIVGLCSAYYLMRQGKKVRILESSQILEGCSHGNAGHICHSHNTPLSNPGVFKESLFWLFNSKSPFFIRPRISPSLFSWGEKFIKSAFEKSGVEKSKVLGNLGLTSLEEYYSLFKEIGFLSIQSGGILTLCNSENGLMGEKELAEFNKTLGIKSKVLSKEEIVQKEPATPLNAIGGVQYPDDISVDPSELVSKLSEYLLKSQVEIEFDCKAIKFCLEKNRVSHIQSTKGDYYSEQYLLATGAWAPKLWNPLGSKIYMEPAKGYSIDIKNQGKINSASLIFAEKKVVVTPMNDRLRIAGTLELSGFDEQIRPNRVEGILNGLKSFAPELYYDGIREKRVWFGYRPTSPDGLPYIGQHPDHDNLFINAGHAMLGLALGSGSGKLISGMMLENQIDHSISHLSPTRF